MASGNFKVWTPEQIAECTQTAVEDVMAEIKAGHIACFHIGGQPRVTEAALQAFMAGDVHQPGDGAPGTAGQSPQLQSVAISPVLWKPRSKFIYTWPDGKTKEPYAEAYEADVSLSSGKHHFVIGYATREAAGIKDRRRVIVFLGHVPQIVPVVEFCGANDFTKTKRVASVIKDSGNKHVRSQAQLPAEYQALPTAIYSEVVIGPYAAKSMAVVADDNDRDLMLRHAIIRARYKGIIQG